MTHTQIPIEWRLGLAVGAVFLAVFAWLFAPIFASRHTRVSPSPTSLAPKMVTITVKGILPEEALLMSSQASWLRRQWVYQNCPPIYYSPQSGSYYMSAYGPDTNEYSIAAPLWWSNVPLPITGRKERFTGVPMANVTTARSLLPRQDWHFVTFSR